MDHCDWAANSQVVVPVWDWTRPASAIILKHRFTGAPGSVPAPCASAKVMLPGVVPNVWPAVTKVSVTGSVQPKSSDWVSEYVRPAREPVDALVETVTVAS